MTYLINFYYKSSNILYFDAKILIIGYNNLNYGNHMSKYLQLESVQSKGAINAAVEGSYSLKPPLTRAILHNTLCFGCKANKHWAVFMRKNVAGHCNPEAENGRVVITAQSAINVPGYEQCAQASTNDTPCGINLYELYMSA